MQVFGARQGKPREYSINEIVRVEILTMIDNYIDITAMDNTPVISRAGGTKKGKIINSVLAEHGYAALIRTTTADETTRTMLFDFGFSKGGVAFNARALGVDMGGWRYWPFPMDIAIIRED